jgi:hypothetical protein
MGYILPRKFQLSDYNYLIIYNSHHVSRDSAVDIATGYVLDDQGV